MKIYSWGANSYGQLSHGMQSEQCLSPTEAASSFPLEEVVAVSAGGGHTLILDAVGNLFGSGSNANGQLADCQNNTTVLSKVRALQEFKITQIECGWDSSYAITDNGLVVTWGSNRYGQLGISKEKLIKTNHPVILQVPHIIQVSAGLRHAAMVSSDGHVFCCGQGSKGQLGILDSDGNVPKKDVDLLTKVEGLQDVKEVACGQHHTLALTLDGQLYGWGDNRRGQLGEGSTSCATPQLIKIFDSDAIVRAGWTHSAVLSGGRVTTWGRNDYNQLGHNCGQKQVNMPDQLTSLQGVKQLELGSEHNLALLDNGEVWSWGWNEHGNCGTGTVDNIEVPRLVNIPTSTVRIAAGGGHSLASC